MPPINVLLYHPESQSAQVISLGSTHLTHLSTVQFVKRVTPAVLFGAAVEFVGSVEFAGASPVEVGDSDAGGSS